MPLQKRYWFASATVASWTCILPWNISSQTMRQWSSRSYKFFITTIRVHKIHLVFCFSLIQIFLPRISFQIVEELCFGWLISPLKFCYLLRPSHFLKDLLCLLEFCVWWKCSSVSKSKKCRLQTHLVFFWVYLTLKPQERSRAICLHWSMWHCWSAGIRTGASAHLWNTSHEVPFEL